MGIPVIQGEIVSRVLALEHVDDECETFENELIGREEKFRQVVARVKPDHDLFVIFNIPANTPSIFITVSDGDRNLIRQVISNLEEIEKEGKQLEPTDVVAFEDKNLLASGVVAVVLVPLSVSGILCDLEESFSLNGKVYRFCLVVFLSKDEHELWKKQGSDALVSYFDSVDKDLLTFSQFE
ncbi:hypothetical protein [Hyphococcus sp.]|jgi:hypothetical protein|uniref:hypothetical protein n=1 Tax=Hyphococcus sp. TaxID=2038636 RepID=UPI003D12051D